MLQVLSRKVLVKLAEADHWLASHSLGCDWVVLHCLLWRVLTPGGEGGGGGEEKKETATK